jgi:hypothetical protein
MNAPNKSLGPVGVRRKLISIGNTSLSLKLWFVTEHAFEAFHRKGARSVLEFSLSGF